MNRVKEILLKIHEAIKSLLSRIEESALFERLMLAYEALDPSRQAVARGVLRLFFFVLGFWIILSPIWKSYSTKSAIRTYKNSAFQLQVAAAKGNEVVSQAPKPPTWQPLPASNSGELENSLREYLANIGIPEDYFVAQADGMDRLSITIDELTLKQALAITFQFDGWYPAVRTENLELKVHQVSADRLSLKLAAYIPAVVPGGGDFGGHDTDFEGSNHDANGGGDFGGGGMGDGGTSHFGGDDGEEPDYFENDPNQVPAPPPEFNDNPPPPPPSFDDNFDDNPPVFDDGGDL